MAAATSEPAPTVPAAATPLPEGVVDSTTVDPAASTSTTSTTSSSTTSTTTTTTTVPTPPVTSGLIPPLVDAGQGSEVGEAATTGGDARRSRVRARTTTSGATLPLTGDSTIAVLAAGLGALSIGALALWWGSRRRPEVDAPNPPAMG